MRIRGLAVLAPLLNRKTAMSYLLFADYDMIEKRLQSLNTDVSDCIKLQQKEEEIPQQS